MKEYDLQMTTYGLAFYFSDEFAGLVREVFRLEFQGREDIQQAVDSGFGIEKLADDGYFAVFHDAITALKAAFFIPHGIIQFPEQVFQFF